MTPQAKPKTVQHAHEATSNQATSIFAKHDGKSKPPTKKRVNQQHMTTPMRQRKQKVQTVKTSQANGGRQHNGGRKQKKHLSIHPHLTNSTTLARRCILIESQVKLLYAIEHPYNRISRRGRSSPPLCCNHAISDKKKRSQMRIKF